MQQFLQEIRALRQKQDWAGWFIFLLPQSARVSGSETSSDGVKPVEFRHPKLIRPRNPCGAQYMEHAIITWFAICLMRRTGNSVK